MIVDLPIHLFAPAEPSVTPEYLSRPDQEATNGFARSMGMAGARFLVTLGSVPVFGTERIRSMRALLARIEGRSRLVRFCLPDLHGLDGPFSQRVRTLSKTLPSDLLPADAVLMPAPWDVPPLTAVISDAAARLDRDVYLAATAPFDAGVWVSIEELCYTVTDCVAASGGRAKVTLSPPLRRAVTPGALFSFRPVFVGRLVTDMPGREALRQGRGGYHSFDFIEDLTRAASAYAPG